MSWSRWALSFTLLLAACESREGLELTRPPARSSVRCTMTLTAEGLAVPEFPPCSGTWWAGDTLSLGSEGGSWWTTPPGWRAVVAFSHLVTTTELDSSDGGIGTFEATVGFEGDGAWYDGGRTIGGSRAHLSLSPGNPWSGVLTLTLVADAPGVPETATLEVRFTEGELGEVSP